MGPGEFSRSPSLASDVDVCSLDPTQAGRPARAIYFGTGGAIKVQHPGDRDNSSVEQTQTWGTVVAGSYIPCCISRIIASGTTVTSVILIW